MDAKDRQIIRELQKDGRLTNQDLADRVNLSASPCLRRLRALEDAGVITGYTAIVDQNIWGLPLTVFTRISLDKHNADAVKTFEDHIQKINEVLECYLTAGDADYIMRVIVPSLDDYEAFVRKRLHEVPGIASIVTSFAYGKVKQSFIFPDMSAGNIKRT